MNGAFRGLIAVLLLVGCGNAADRDADAGLERARAGDFEGAAVAFLRALEADETHPKALYNLGLLRGAQGDSRAAEALFARFVAAHPEDALGRFEHARALAQLDEPEPALQELQEAVRLGFSDHAALVAGDFEALRTEVPFVMLEVTVAQRSGTAPLSARAAAEQPNAAAPTPRIRPPRNQDENCAPTAATTLVPADPIP
ncbi:tetratricopeptide repeat protein [Vulgatibacter sp.]|uniref:tetratricopeptide repeat protein n=1 Tax=Vulgatibacter sp. TaxID=1971226 RepID=UPI003566E7A3